MDEDKLQQRIADFDMDCNYSVLLLILAESPHEELRAKRLLMLAQQQPLPSRHEALHNLVRNLKVKCCHKAALVCALHACSACTCAFWIRCRMQSECFQQSWQKQLQRPKHTCDCYMHSSQHGGRAAESCAYFTCVDGNVQVKGGVRFMPLAGRHIAAAVCHIVRARQKATACSTPEEMEITAEMSQCPVTCFLAHELSPKEIALLQGKPCSAYGFCLA